MVVCRSCGERLPVEAFYASNKSRCKECVKARAREYRELNIEKIRDYDRNRPNHEERREANKQRYRQVTADPKKRREYFKSQKRWRDKNFVKRRAHVMVGNAIKYGQLKKQPCERCGHAIDVHAHHEDYYKPLEVTWLCPPCHMARHREINEERRRVA